LNTGDVTADLVVYLGTLLVSVARDPETDIKHVELILKSK